MWLGRLELHICAERAVFGGSLEFKGKCRSPEIIIRIDGTIVAPLDYGVLGKSRNWFSFEGVTGVSLTGSGTFDAKGPSLWACKASHSNSCPSGTTTLSFTNSNNIRINGLTIGSLAKDLKEEGVQNVTVKKTTFSNTQNGLRIKSWARPSTGFVEGVRFMDSMMRNVQNPVVIDQNYCPRNENCPGQVSGVKIKDIMYTDIRGTSSTPIAIKFDCSTKNPCTGIELQNVNLTYLNKAAQSFCSNVVGTLPCNSVTQIHRLFTRSHLQQHQFSPILKPSSSSHNQNHTFSLIQDSAVIACLRANSAEQAMEAARAAVNGGITVLEIVRSTPGVFEVLQALVNEYPTKAFGVGTVLTAEDAKTAIKAGAKFLMSPATVNDIIDTVQDADVLYIPGAMTPTEIASGKSGIQILASTSSIFSAHNAGAKIVKIYPVSALGGVRYISAIMKPFSHIPMVASQGITIDSVGDYIAHGAISVVLSDAIFSKEAMNQNNFNAVSQLAKSAALQGKNAVERKKR
ncbi:hypothetical protein V6N11_054257 [Hibiscus sabdariffa]|uniref:Uncharacterized protein n=1 Tax=Hibiscus sabdariffa TaxID=183260 RepID=A0ABR2S465_9ROSI